MYERRYDRGVADLLDDEYGHGGLVPGQALGGGVLDRPEKRGKIKDILVNKSKMWETLKRYPEKKERKKISYRGV